MSKRYEVGFPSERAKNEFYKNLSKASGKEKVRILDWFNVLAENPRPEGKSFKFLKGEMVIFQNLAQYRVREGDWRILYDIDEMGKKVILLALRRRGQHTYH